MVKWALTIGCAVALLALAHNAVSEVDEDGEYVFYDEKELDAYAAKLAEEEVEEKGGGGWLDTCFLCRPVPYLLVTVHSEGGTHSHTDTDIYWDSENSYYYACYNNDVHMYSNVDRIKAYWKTTSVACCDYCDWEDWHARHFEPGFGEIMEDYDCNNSYSPTIYYWGDEATDFDDHDFAAGDNFAKFNRSGTSTDSLVKLVN